MKSYMTPKKLLRGKKVQTVKAWAVLAIDALEPPEPPISLVGEDGKLFSRVAAKCMEAPFPEVAIQHAFQRVHEAGKAQALKEVRDELKAFSGACDNHGASDECCFPWAVLEALEAMKKEV